MIITLKLGKCANSNMLFSLVSMDFRKVLCIKS